MTAMIDVHVHPFPTYKANNKTFEFRCIVTVIFSFLSRACCNRFIFFKNATMLIVKTLLREYLYRYFNRFLSSIDHGVIYIYIYLLIHI